VRADARFDPAYPGYPRRIDTSDLLAAGADLRAALSGVELAPSWHRVRARATGCFGAFVEAC